MSDANQTDGLHPTRQNPASHQYWNRSLGLYYNDLSHRLAVYLLVGAAYAGVTFLAVMVYYGPAWVFSDLAYLAAYALQTALVFAGSLAAVDILANRLVKRRLGYAQRTVGRQWLVMFAGFLVALALFGATFPEYSEFYGSLLFGHDPALPTNVRQYIYVFLLFFIFWLITTYGIINFAQRSQQTALGLWVDSAQDTSPGPDDQAGPDGVGGFLTLRNQNQKLKIPFADITHVTVEDHYCRLFQIKDDEVVSHMLRIPLKRLESKLSRDHFTRIHRSHIVNLGHVLGWRMEGQQRRLVMDHDIGDLPISLHRFRQLSDTIMALQRYQSGRMHHPTYKDISAG